MNHFLAILLCGIGENSEWRLFQMVMYLPAGTVFVSYLLISWKPRLAFCALALAICSSAVILLQLSEERAKRSAHEEFVRSERTELQKRYIPTLDSPPTEEDRSLNYALGLRAFGENFVTEQGIPPLTKPMIIAVWFSAIYPFIAVLLFYYSRPRKAPHPIT